MTLEDTAVKEGKDAVFKCSTDDDEAPVQWFINGQPISPSDKYRIASDGTDHTLTITGVQPGEDCEVTVSIGENKSSAKLNVQGENGKCTKICSRNMVCSNLNVIHSPQ